MIRSRTGILRSLCEPGPLRREALEEAHREAVQSLSDELCWARGAPSKRSALWRRTVRQQIAGIRAMRRTLAMPYGWASE